MKKNQHRPVATGGLSHEEIAKRLGLSYTQVKKLERRALKKMRDAVAAGWRS